MSSRRYLIYDVFTDTALTGNPLAIVLDSEGLDDAAMRRIAGEFNLSETVFVAAPENPIHTARIRIFTPRMELPFAGHPTVGTAVALAENGIEAGAGDRASLMVLEENIGPVRCAVAIGDAPAFAEFDLPRIPEPFDLKVSSEAVAAALGLSHHEIGFENHVISSWSAGVPFLFVPVADLEVAAKAKLDTGLWRELTPQAEGIVADAYVYCRETVNHDCAFHARMFGRKAGIIEDPATGSAAAAFAGAIHAFDGPLDGTHRFWIEQGLEMGRPSRIRLEMEIGVGAIQSARIGGNAVKLAEGRLLV